MEPTNQLPWIIFDLNEQLYAISTEMVTGILQFPPVTPVANAPEIFLGLANIRGEVVPILDLKKLLKVKDNSAFAEAALTALNYKLGGIEDYLREMRRCVEKKEKFAVSADYFGDKIDLHAFQDGSQTHSLLLQVKEGQRKLEEYGEKIGSQGSLLEDAVKLGKELEGIINTTIRHISDQSKKMVITLTLETESPQSSVGFVVDNVRSVDALDIINNKGSRTFLFTSSQISSVAHNDKIKGEILVVNDKEVVKTIDMYREYLKKEEEKKKRLQEQKAAEEKAKKKATENEKQEA